MPRSLRVQYPGARYHVMCRGNRGEKVLGEARDKALLLRTFGEAAERSGWMAHAYALLDTHWHFLLETPEANLARGMGWFQSVFAQRRNRAHGMFGHVYQGRYKAKVIDDRDSSYFRVVSEYIHLNPVEAGLCGPGELEMDSYPWCSFRFYRMSKSKRPIWLDTTRVLLSNGIVADSPKGRRAYGALLEQRAHWLLAEKARKNNFPEWWRLHERGWLAGSEVFRERMLAHLSEGDPSLLNRDEDQRRGCGELAAAKYLARALDVVGIDEAELGALAKGDVRKRLVAGWLKRHFDVSNGWIAERLHMGHITTVSTSAKTYANPPRDLRKQAKGLHKILNL